MSTLIDGINAGLAHEMERDPSVLVMGEDVATIGGVFRATKGLLERFGPDRCIDTPLSEAGIVGTAVGLAMVGWRPVCEIQYESFSYPALDQVICHVGRYRWRSGGRRSLPVVIRMPCGGGVRAPELHQDSPEAYYVHTPGVKVAVPSTPDDAKGLVASAVRDPDPVVLLEPKRLYREPGSDVPEADHVVPLGTARTVRTGDDITLVSYGAMVGRAVEAAAELARDGVGADVIDLRTLKPLDEQALLRSVEKTGRVVIVHEAPPTAGVAAEVAALIADRALLHLRAPVARVTGYDVAYPYWRLEDVYLPSVERIVGAAREALLY